MALARATKRSRKASACLLYTSRNVDAILRPREYLATIARGLVTDAYRRQAIERAYLETLAARPEPVAISPETRAILLETVLAIDRMLAQLGPRTREILDVYKRQP